MIGGVFGLPADYHIHTKRCGHATGEMGEYLAEAIKKGIWEVGFADHFPLYFQSRDKRDQQIAMDECEIDYYISDLIMLRHQESRRVNVRLGFEVDYIPGHEEFLKKTLRQYPLDYVLGSVHYIDGWAFDHPDFTDKYAASNIDEVYHRYFQLVREAARSGLFDIMAHADLIKKFNYHPSADFNLLEEYRKTARVFSEASVCVEVNTAGLRSPVGEIYPTLDFLKLCREYMVPVTLGSDAHRPDQVGQDFDRATALLKSVGYRETAVFQFRKIIGSVAI